MSTTSTVLSTTCHHTGFHSASTITWQKRTRDGQHNEPARHILTHSVVSTFIWARTTLFFFLTVGLSRVSLLNVTLAGGLRWKWPTGACAYKTGTDGHKALIGCCDHERPIYWLSCLVKPSRVITVDGEVCRKHRGSRRNRNKAVPPSL